MNLRSIRACLNKPLRPDSPCAKYLPTRATSARRTCKATVDMGAAPFIPFRSNVQPDCGTDLWSKMFFYYNYKREEFLAHYHKRSNVETTFSMIKSKFGERLRSK